MKCQKCGKHDATTHITEIINGVKSEIYLCKYCGGEYNHSNGFHSIFKNNFDSFFEDFWKSPNVQGLSYGSSAKTCPVCKNTITDIQKRGRLGCSECYNTFRDFLLRSLKSIHGADTYEGRLPKKLKFKIEQTDETERLKQELKLAVEAQNFEKAAELRDKIKGLEA